MAKKLQMCGTEDEMRDVAAKICRDYLHGAWKTIDSKELIFRRISGGLSNFLYYVALPEASSTCAPGDSPVNGSFQQRRNTLATIQVLLRIYGQVHGERAMDAIITESVIFTLLSERKLGPKLHGVFSGGRIEEYIPARPLLTRELSEPSLSMKIAEKMAAIHSMDIPLSKEPVWLWKILNRWMKMSMEMLDTPKVKNNEEKACVDKLKSINYEKEIEWLNKYLTGIESPVVFCHNDMQEGNILLKEDVQTASDDAIEELSCSHYDYGDDPSPAAILAVKSDKENNGSVEVGNGNGPHFIDDDASNTRDSLYSHASDNGEPKLVLIDFEYCAYNYRAFDLANHFIEWTYDYTNADYPYYYFKPEQYPTLEQKVIFMRQYLKHCNIQQQRLGCRDPELDVEPTIEEINQLNSEVDAFTLCSHILWCLWSIISASRSEIPFGYWDYATSRLDEFQRHKMDAVKKESAGNSAKRRIREMDI